MSFEIIVSSSDTVCLVGGAELDPRALSVAIKEVSHFVGVDGGADHLLRADLQPTAVIGDLDSISDGARVAFANVTHHVSEQSTTDFEKALLRVAAPAVLCLGFTGGRVDHALSVLNVMARYACRAILLMDEHDVCFVARPGRSVLSLPKETRVSLMPLGAATVTVSGVKWSFENRLMTPAGFTSPSNAALGGDVTVETDGPVLITLPLAHLATALKAAARAE